MAETVDIRPDFLLTAFDSLGIPVFLIDDKRIIITANSAASNVFQYPLGDFAGLDLGEFLLSEKGKLPVEAGPAVKGAHSMHFTGSFRRRDGMAFLGKVSVLPHEREGQRIVVIQDISKRVRLEERASQRTKELTIINTFGNILSRHTDTKKIIRDMVNDLPSILDVEACWMHLVDDRSGQLHLEHQKGYDADSLDDVRVMEPGECLNGRVLASGRALMVRKASEDPRVTRVDPTRTGLESIASVPVMSRRKLWGVLTVASSRVSCFSAMDMQILSIIGSHLGAVIENGRLVEELHEKMKQIELTNELSGTINSSLSIGTIFRIMVSEIRKLISYDRASLLLYDHGNNQLIIYALDTHMKTVLPKGVKAPIEGTSAGWVARNNRPWIAGDLAEELPFVHDRKLLEEGIRSTISIPLYEDKMLGVFNLDSIKPHAYSRDTLEILRPVAKHISIALENALLFEEISKEKKEWEKTFDAITDMVWITDTKETIIRANQAILKRTGLSTADLSGICCGELLERIGIAAGECLSTETTAAKEPSFREFKGRSGSIFHLWAYALADDDGKLYATVHYLKDVTSQKRLEQQLVRADRLASLGTLVAGIAHEINNPLGIIAAYSEALLDRAGERRLLGMEEFEDFPEYLKTIHNEIFRCKEILRTLLEFARPQRGRFREIDINELIKEVMLLVNHKAKSLNYDIALALNRDVPKVCAETGSLRQLFMNIIINAMYFTPEGGTIRIGSGRTRTVTRESAEPVEMVEAWVRDSGAGMPESIVERIFDPFFTTKPIGEGTGLGLAICHKIAEEHGGFIDVESRLGEGTTVTIRLPAKGSHDEDESACG
jgi:two-component system NtrC family sensor kinase